MKNFLFLSLVALLATACFSSKEERYVQRMVGTWDVAEIQLDSVGADGTHRTLFTGENVGTFTFAPSFDNGSSFTEITYDYTVRGNRVTFSGSATFDEEVERMQVYFENCNETFNCDGMYELQAFSSSTIKMTRYLPQGFVGNIKYLTYTLKKQ